MPLIVFGKWKVSAELQIHPKKIQSRAIKVCKVRENGEKGA